MGGLKPGYSSFTTRPQASRALRLPTGDEEVSVLLQSLAVLADHVVQTQVQLVKGESLLCVGSSFSRRVVVSFLRGEWPVSPSRAALLY